MTYEQLLRYFGIPPMVMGRQYDDPPGVLRAAYDSRCACDHWGCRVGYWHCHGTMGACYVPMPRVSDD